MGQGMSEFGEAVVAEGQSARAERLRLKNVPCSDCGGRFHPACMDFDHRPETTKVREVSQIHTLAAVQLEARKCDIVCANCHRLRTFNRGRGSKKAQYRREHSARLATFERLI